MRYGFWALVFGFCVGIASAAYVPYSLALVIFVVGLSFVCFVIAPHATFLSIFLISLALGIIRADVIEVRDAALDAGIGSEVSIEGTVIAEPDEREASTRLIVEIESGARVLIVAPSHTGIRYGDRIDAEGQLSFPRAFETGEGRVFDYAAYLRVSGV